MSVALKLVTGMVRLVELPGIRNEETTGAELSTGAVTVNEVVLTLASGWSNPDPLPFRLPT